MPDVTTLVAEKYEKDDKDQVFVYSRTSRPIDKKALEEEKALILKFKDLTIEEENFLRRFIGHMGFGQIRPVDRMATRLAEIEATILKYDAVTKEI